MVSQNCADVGQWEQQQPTERVAGPSYLLHFPSGLSLPLDRQWSDLFPHVMFLPILAFLKSKPKVFFLNKQELSITTICHQPPPPDQRPMI